MNTRLLAIALVVLGAPGCATIQPPEHRIQVDFDEALAQRLLRDGTNTIKGSGLFRQQGGGVVSCAGQVVNLVPATPYAYARMLALYNSSERGVNPSRRFAFIPDPPRYTQLMRQARCDAQGNFVFERVADGEFFVSTSIHWVVGTMTQGGSLMQRASVANSATVNVVLSP